MFRRGIKKELEGLRNLVDTLLAEQKIWNSQATVISVLERLLERRETVIEKLTEKLMAKDFKELKTYEDPGDMSQVTSFSLPSADELETFAGESIPQELLDGKDS